MRLSRVGPVLLMVLLLLITSAGIAGSALMGDAGDALSSVTGFSSGSNGIGSDSKAPDSWTIIIYMAGDNSLGSNGSAGGNQVWSDMNELEAGFEGVANVNILVLADEAGVGDTR